MNSVRSIYDTIQRYRTLYTDKVYAMPIVILMPHSACNCRCVMCDIWKDNKNLKQLREKDVTGMLDSLKALGTQQVLMSGGEAMLHPNFFRFCNILKKAGLSITLLSTGLTVRRYTEQILLYIDELIISLDGDQQLHDQIRNIPGAFNKTAEGVKYLKSIQPSFRITARTVIHRLNFRKWLKIIAAAKAMGVDRISFLPADVSSHAFNRQVLWSEHRQQDIMLTEEELDELSVIIEQIHALYPETPFISENYNKLRKIHAYYAAFYHRNPFPYKKCNAPWVSTVIEADGTVRPCFFHPPIGNIKSNTLEQVINSEKAIRFRKELDMEKDSTCIKCVCYLNLSAGTKLN